MKTSIYLKKYSTSYLRFALFWGVLIAVLVLPWWLSIFVLLVGTIYFPLYLEILFFGFLFDTLYSGFRNFPHTGLFLALLFLVLVLFAKTRVRV